MLKVLNSSHLFPDFIITLMSTQGHSIKDSSKVLLEDGNLVNIISLALKHDFIVFGDENGDLNVWDLKSKISKTIHSKRGPIRKIKFAPGKENLRLLVLYGTHTLEVFDLNKYETISVYKIQTQREKIFDCDWCTSDKPIIVQNDGCVHIVDINLKQIPDQLNYLKLSNALKPGFNAITTGGLFDRYEYHAFKFLLYDSVRHSHDYQKLLTKQNTYFLNDSNLKNNLNDLMANLNDAVVSLLNRTDRVNQVDDYLNLTLAVYSHCGFELKFWSILKYYLDNQVVDSQPLIDYYFLKSKTFRLNELKSLKLYELKRTVSSASLKVNHLINDLILCNETDRVFNMLLETDTSTNANYMHDYMYACLINSLKINNFANPANDVNIANVKSTVKLVATNLIANGKLQGLRGFSFGQLGA
jgi:hypothetical protein